jgi:ubiquinone/menaquinone biosynthesis C-methylase UbiE/alpha-beta hydrolase superfamily lysophospholipase
MKTAVRESTSALSARLVRDDTNKSLSLECGEQPVSLQDSPVPLSFHCLGGNWQGQIALMRNGSLALTLQGMPPVQVGQTIQLQCFGAPSTSVTHIQTGIIQHTNIHRSSSLWKGSTVLLVDAPCSPNILSTVHNSQQGWFPSGLGSFVMGQLTEAEPVYSCEMETPAEGLLPFNTSRGNPMCAANNLGIQKSVQVKSVKVSLHNSFGRIIRAYHDYPTGFDLSRLPVVVLAPGYGETKRDYLPLAYYFAHNGYHVIRYDHTNHVGESEGAHFNSSLSSMKLDFQAVIQNVGQQWPQSPIIGVASSLASRVALKAEAETPSLSLLVLLVGIVDVQQTVATLHQEDVFANYLNGYIQDSANILGFNVGRHFLQDALTSQFSTLKTTLEDVQGITTPIMYIAAGKDAWIEKQALATFKESLHSLEATWIDVPEALHRLQENPKIARTIYRRIIQYCHTHLAISSQDTQIFEPNRGDLGRQNRQEKFVLQEQSQNQVGQTFWSDYLGNFQTVGSCQDYVQLLDHVFHALGPIAPGQHLLDAGCGNGNAGLYFLQSLQKPSIRSPLGSNDPIRYVGIDVVKEALERAEFQMTQTFQTLNKSCDPQFSPIQMSWSQVDLHHQLPFPDNQFDRIVSNLVIGYVDDPKAVLRELFRVLAPGGRMVITNLKPDGDFSVIYQNLVSHIGHRQQKIEARELLNNYGKIRQAEKEGKIRFFDHAEWRTTLDMLNGINAGVHPTFANQAYLIVLEKPEVFTQSTVSTFRHSRDLYQSPTRGDTSFQAAA